MDLSGVPLVTLQDWLNKAMTSWASWQAGGKLASASYSQVDGSRSVSYSITDADQLRAWITSLQREIGCRTGAPQIRRRAIGLRF